jgi:3-phosphoshikimate 1-carboxyvinyltransferase
MNLIVKQTKKISGEILIPGSKSHTIRAVVIASVADGVSTIVNPLDSYDTKAAINACRLLGAQIDLTQDKWIIKGTNRNLKKPSTTLDLMNSGTSINLITGIGSLADFEIDLDGDDSLRTRPMQPLLNSLSELGVKTLSLNNNGKPPIKIQGPIKGGKTTINGLNSQYVSSLLIATPLAKNDTEIFVEDLHEIPYVYITLKWLTEQNIKYEKKEDLSYFKIFGNQSYKSFNKEIPADWSSAAFPIVAGLLAGDNLIIKGLDINDTQGDKKIIDILKSMGGNIKFEDNNIIVNKSKLIGRTIDLNSMPDALPAMSIIGCYAEGETRLVNVKQARIKETDRIKVMHDELKKMGANIFELDDGLVIKKSTLKAADLKGHNDHRVIMSLSVAGLICQGDTVIDTADSINVTFPNYIEKMKNLGANFFLQVES